MKKKANGTLFEISIKKLIIMQIKKQCSGSLKSPGAGENHSYNAAYISGVKFERHL